jgi:hypothetical protein
MIFSMVWGTSRPVVPVRSHPLPSVPVNGQPRGTALLNRTVVACLHILQVMMTPSAHTSCRCLDNARAYLENS